MNVVLLLKDALADGKLDLYVCCGHSRQIEIEISHEVRKLPVLKSKKINNTKPGHFNSAVMFERILATR